MSAAQDTLRNFQLFVSGRGFAGNCEEYTPPKLALTVEDFKAGGLDAALKVETGMESLEVTFTLTKFDAKALAAWGVGPGQSIPFVVRGALQTLGSANAKPIVDTMRGTVREVDGGQWQPQAKATLKIVVDLTYYRRDIDGTPVQEIDVPNMKRIINGVDALASIRSALGMPL